eukprot:COSAG04_NODE_538_length_12896_cov_41.168243_10_plen_326_part_00
MGKNGHKRARVTENRQNLIAQTGNSTAFCVPALPVCLRFSHNPAVPQDACAAGRGDQYIEHGGYTWRTLDGANPAGGAYDAPNGGCQCTADMFCTENFYCNIPSRRCESPSAGNNHLPLPAGWVLAPNDATSIDYDSDCHPWQSSSNPATDNWPECSGSTSIAIVAAHGWSTSCAVLADGTAWRSGNLPDPWPFPEGSSGGDRCGVPFTTSSEWLYTGMLATSGGTYTVTDCSMPESRMRVLARCGGPPPPPCATLPAAADGMEIAYSFNGHRADNTVATYSCAAAGYVPSGGDATRTCSADGSWDGTAPTTCVVRANPLLRDNN